MTHKLGNGRITIDPDVMQGKPCVRGTRITVGLIVNLVAHRMAVKEILKEYPGLQEEDVVECLKYAASLAEDRVVPYEEPAGAVPL